MELLEQENKNLQASNDFLKEENRREAEKLQSTLKLIEKANEDLEKVKLSADAEHASLEVIRGDLALKKDEIFQREERVKQLEADLQDRLQKGEIALGIALEEVRKARQKIESLKEEEALVQANIRRMQGLLEDEKILKGKIDLLVKDILVLKDKKLEADKDLAKAQGVYETSKEQMEKAIGEWKEIVRIKQGEALESENRKTAFDVEYENKKNDINVYANRIKDHYKKVFPDQEIKL